MHCFVHSFLVRLKVMFRIGVDVRILNLFRLFEPSIEDGKVCELFKVIAQERSAELALACITMAFPDESTLEDAIKQDLAIVKSIQSLTPPNTHEKS